MESLRYGILSTSSIAPRFIAAVREGNAGEIVAVSSRTLDRAKDKAAQWRIPTAYGSHWELLEDPNVDIVYISTVNSQHYPWAKAALEHGKHVICEKPCTMSAAQTKELFSIAREKKRFLMEAEKMLFLPAVQALKRKIDAGELGQIRMVEMSHSFAADYNAWMFDEKLGGGVLLSSGIYAVQLLLWLFGPIASIRGLRSCGPEGTERQYILSGETESGVLFCAKNSTQARLDNTARIYGTKGWAELPEYWKARSVTFHINGEEKLEFPCEHELIYEAQHIQDCISQGLLTSQVVTESLSVSGIGALERVKESW